MGRFGFDPSSVVAGIEILPKGDYVLELSNVKAFQRTNREGKESYGLRLSLTVKTTDNSALIGKKIPHTLYMHSEGAQKMSKGFVMAAYGYLAKDEKAFNEFMTGKDWGFDPDTPEDVGEVWKGLEGKLVFASLDVSEGQNNQEQQSFKTVRPYAP